MLQISCFPCNLVLTQCGFSLDAPILFQPDTDFHSLNGISEEPDSWLEMPLKSDRPLPFQCAVRFCNPLHYRSLISKDQITLPNPMTIRRAGARPYFVIFTTTPRPPHLAREIASDATISISFLRQVAISESTPPSTPSSSPSSTCSSQRSTPPFIRGTFLKRVVKS